MSLPSRFRCFFIYPIIFFASIYLFTYIWVVTQVNQDSKQKSDVIIVLGAKVNLTPQTINPCLVSRVSRGVDLYNQGYSNKIIFSGGTDHEDGAVEAEAMKQMAIDSGVSLSDILTESTSSSTYENLINSRQLMKQNNFQTALIVTETFHSPRASLIAKKLKLDYSVSPADSICWSKWKYLSWRLWREPLALVIYFIKGQI
ncbi:MAG: YdcF family protein [Candidatus Shapirobacteria bacterium]|jgi:uncharacterized SAM-binding protein YcdF (DUF218 family)